MPSDQALVEQQRALLGRLARHLYKLPKGYSHFDMGTYHGVGRGRHQVDKTLQYFRQCGHRLYGYGVVGCALGHLPTVDGAPVSDGPFDTWEKYVRRHLTPLIFDRRGSPTDAFDWCFSTAWVGTNNTPRGAAQRIWWFLENGLPEDWMHQMTGETPLCYTKVVIPEHERVRTLLRGGVRNGY